MSKTFVLTDLDGTLFASQPIPGADQDAALPRVQSVVTPDREKLIDLYLQAGANFVPVTGRTLNAFNNAQEKYVGHVDFGPYWILSHGAVVTLNGSLDPEWQAHIAAECAEAAPKMAAINDQVLSFIAERQLPIKSHVLEDQGIPCYVSIKSLDRSSREQHFNEMLRVITDVAPFDIHMNGDNMAIKPAYTSKARALQYVMDKLGYNPGRDLLIGAGDSISDIPFMALCDFMLVPTDSQITKFHQE